ncbi:iron-sulfur cluster biosynthesis transcriptional regulator SufR [Cyanobium sp. CH-040]|uniref:iron-sulfur cluster biosynthesis transcriptional regulator SufR n=1 Tax=Cyanobium sp. CH-040 TaxID=2823708 RepID=UPI0020CE9336|nr:iron-sulfur cluster biosynthesis transcriptional regulator SufR [Cyanobium sp. CH-040]MCP9927266.1 iron-sulfur cluster biosynthesis transcriptional regulator SufR [Cyanobium sp. CH-040]
MGSHSATSTTDTAGVTPPAATPPVPTTSAAAPPQSSTREEALSLLLRRGQATASELAHALEVSVQAMRRHLRSLEDDGLVQASPASEGPGRPSNRWQLTAKAQDHFPDGSEQFALSLLESISGSLPAETLRSLLAQQAVQKAALYRARIGDGPLQQRLERLVELRRQEGYVAECAPDQNGRSWLMRELHCSVMRIAEKFPCVCDQELSLIRNTFPDCAVERVQWRLEQGHSCGFRLCPTAGDESRNPG